jgi:hypothetical protein
MVNLVNGEDCQEEWVFDMTKDLIYEESVFSNRTEALFLALASLFSWLTVRGRQTHWRGLFSAVTLSLAAFFLFYSINFRTLRIRLTSDQLEMKFGIFRWTVPLDHIEEVHLDELPPLMRLGGAGIHFMSIRNRYRASFNFLEHPRVVIALKRQVGPVQDISFSTRHPEDIIRLTRTALAANR